MSNLISAGLRAVSYVPYIGELGNLGGNETSDIKKFNQALEHLNKTYESKKLEDILNASRNVQEKLKPLLENKDKYSENFKGWSRIFSSDNLAFTSAGRWENYLKPMHDLDRELSNLIKGATDGTGYDLRKLGEPLKGAIGFVNHELSKQRGVVNKLVKKALDGTVNAFKEKRDELTVANAPRPVITPPRSALMNLLSKIGHLKTESSTPDYIAKNELLTEIEAVSM